MKQILALSFICIFILTSCDKKSASQNTTESIEMVDSLETKIYLSEYPTKVIALGSSLADIWLTAGGSLFGVTSDAFGDRGLSIDKDVSIVGSLESPNMEVIISMQPDLILLTSTITSHTDMIPILKKSGIPYYVSKVETFDDYLFTLNSFTTVNVKSDLYKKNGLDIKNNIETLLNDVPKDKKTTVLFLRAYSAGVKAIAKDHFVSDLLAEINTTNIAGQNQSILEDLSLEAIIEEDPDFIFVVTMGSDTEAALISLENSLTSNPSWENLSAVKNNRLVILPKKLYHYKPNNRWDEAYEYLLKIIYPEIYK
jgi:iron complex transport system substrate-binding protein